MKKLPILLIVPVVFWFACQTKEKAVPQTVVKKDTTVSTDTAKPVKTDTITYPGIQDDATMNIRMVKDSNIWNSFQIKFDRKYVLNTPGSQQGGPPSSPGGLGGNYPITIYVLSYDSVDLVIHGVPYIHGMSMGIDADATASGNYFLGAQPKTFYRIPSYIHVWLKDNYLKDSLDLRTGNYQFNIDRTNPATFGKRRFYMILR